MTSSASQNIVASYWDKFVGTHLNNPVHWEANMVTQQAQWKYISGDPLKNPIHWFLEKYKPFGAMASICCGSGLLERDIAANYLQHKDAQIVGYDISPGSVEVAMERAQGLRGIAYEVCDVNTAVWHEGYLDAAFAHGALHHVQNLDHCLGQLGKALKPKGLLFVNDYVGPQRFQWTDVQLRLAKQALEMVPQQFRVEGAQPKRCDPVALEAMDPSEAVRSHHIMEHIRAHFRIEVLRNRGGTLLAPIFGCGCIAPSAFESAEGMRVIQALCDFERDLIDREIISADHVVVIARPRK